MSVEAESGRRPNGKLGLAVAYYLGLPLLVALIAGWNQAYLGEASDRWFSIGFWIGLQLLIWYGAFIGSYAVFRLLKRWRPPLWFILTAGIALAWILFLPIIGPYLDWGRSVSGVPPATPVPAGFTWAFVSAVLNGLVPGTIFWISTNYFFDRVLDLPRFRYELEGNIEVADSPAAQHGSGPRPPLIQRLPVALRGPVVYLKAEDHFVRVCTTAGQHLIYSRLKDAIGELGGVPGLRVHRSYWVASASITGMEKNGHSHLVQLTNGERIPVSRSFLNDVRRQVNNTGAAE